MIRMTRGRNFILLFFGIAILGQSLPASAQESDGRLEAIGALTASHVYLSHGFIGMMADGYVEEVYTADETFECLNELDIQIDIIVERLDAVVDAGVSSEDEVYIDDLLTIYRQLKLQTNYLKEYTQNGNHEDLQDWSSVRDRCWGNIKDLLGL